MGPSVTTGDASLQDGSTPMDFIRAVERRFGPIALDLAAHRGNKKHGRYYAPRSFPVRYDPEKPFSRITWQEQTLAKLVAQGAKALEAQALLSAAVAGRQKCRFEVPNHDPEALAFDSRAQSWASALRLYAGPGGAGVGWLNPEWADIDPWAVKCAWEARQGADLLLLTHVAITDWWTDHIAGKADVTLLKGRLSFDGGKNVLPKDCMLSRFWPGATGRMAVWDWRVNGTALVTWDLCSVGA